MKQFTMIMVFFAFGVIASEIVTKSSAPFSFPTTVGVVWKNTVNENNASFISQTRRSGKNIVEFLWSFSSKVDKGNISVFNLSGSRIKMFSVSSREGSVQWDIYAGKKIAQGIYFAKLTCGNFKKDLRIIIN
jgi:hypothetical protein